MATVRSWFKTRWPAADDLLLIDVRGSERKLRPFLRKHSFELGMVRRDGDWVSFRAFVPARLRSELKEHASDTATLLNASDTSERIHAPLITSAAGNRFQDGSLPRGVGLPTRQHDPLLYWSVDEVDTALANLESSFPGMATRIPLSHPTAGKNKPCWALRIGHGPAASKDVLVLLGGVHGAEWGSCECLIQFATDLLTASQGNGMPLVYQGQKQVTFSAAQVLSIFDRMDIVLFPLVNRDGREHSQANRSLWRKNRNPAYSNGVAAQVGVDINRNFDFLAEFGNAFDDGLFGTNVSDTSETNFSGPAAFSEPETLNVKELLDSLPRAKWMIDLHSAWQTVLYPWSDDEPQSDEPGMNFMSSSFDGMRGVRNDRVRAGDAGYREFMPAADLHEYKRLSGLLADGLEAVNARAHTRRPFFDYGTFFGTSIDYAYSRHFVDPSLQPVMALHMEWGDNLLPNPDWSLMEGTLLPEVVSALTSFCINV